MGKGKPVIFVPCISNVSATCENDKLYISMCSARGTLKSIQYITRIYFYVFSDSSVLHVATQQCLLKYAARWYIFVSTPSWYEVPAISGTYLPITTFKSGSSGHGPDKITTSCPPNPGSNCDCRGPFEIQNDGEP